MAVLAVACVGVVAYQTVLFITGAATWDAAWFPLLMGQLGAVFFGIFASAFWSYHSDTDIQTLLVWLLFGLLLELSILTGYDAHYEYSTGSKLVNQGVRALCHITDVEVRRSRSVKHNFRKIWFTYEFHTPEGKLIKGESGASYSWWSNESLKTLSKHRNNVPVLYLAENPQCSNIDNFWLLWDQLIIAGALFTIFTGVCLFFLYRLLRPTRRRPRYSKRSGRRRLRMG